MSASSTPPETGRGPQSAAGTGTPGPATVEGASSDTGLPGKVVRAAVAALQERLAARPFQGSALFVIEGEGALRVDAQGVRACPPARAGDGSSAAGGSGAAGAGGSGGGGGPDDAPIPVDPPVEVTLRADRATFEALFSGATSPAGAFMSGRLQIEGDMGAAMRLGAALA